MRIDATTLRRLWPRASADMIEGVAAQSQEVFAKYGITTRLRAAHFMAQISHESGGGTIREEDLQHYTAQRITEVWPTRFHCVEDAQPYAHNGRKLADKVYNGVKPDGSDRMGNRPGTDDGWNYRGRGPLQLTGRWSYRQIGGLTGLALEQKPDLAALPSVGLEIAACEFKKLGCLPFADRDNVEAVSRRVNGGTIGLASRKEWLLRWKRVKFSEDDGPVPLPEPRPEEPAEPPPVEIPRGSDDHLPPVVENPDKGMTKSKTGWASITGAVTAVAAILGQAMDAIKPLLEDPKILALVLVVIVGAAVFVWFDRRKRFAKDHAGL